MASPFLLQPAGCSQDASAPVISPGGARWALAAAPARAQARADDAVAPELGELRAAVHELSAELRARRSGWDAVGALAEELAAELRAQRADRAALAAEVRAARELRRGDGQALARVLQGQEARLDALAAAVRGLGATLETRGSVAAGQSRTTATESLRVPFTQARLPRPSTSRGHRPSRVANVLSAGGVPPPPDNVPPPLSFEDLFPTPRLQEEQRLRQSIARARVPEVEGADPWWEDMLHGRGIWQRGAAREQLAGPTSQHAGAGNEGGAPPRGEAVHGLLDAVLTDAEFTRIVDALGALGVQSNHVPPATREQIEALEEGTVQPDGSDPATCRICWDVLTPGQRHRKLPCGHSSYHTSCIDTWLSGHHASCPECRAQLPPAPRPAADELSPGPRPGSASLLPPPVGRSGSIDTSVFRAPAVAWASSTAESTALPRLVAAPRRREHSDSDWSVTDLV